MTEKKWEEEARKLFEESRGYWNNISGKKECAIYFYLAACRKRQEEIEKLKQTYNASRICPFEHCPEIDRIIEEDAK